MSVSAAFTSRRAGAFVLFIGAALALSACKKDEAAAESGQGASALAVSTAPVTTRELARGLTVSGPVAPVEEMQLGVEVTGLRVTSLNVDVGQQVRRGQLLLTLDHRTLDSDLAQANAALREAEAGAQLARSNLARGQQLASGRYISAMQLDELRANRTASEARLGTARAARDAAALRRSFADLRAPASGLISKRLVQPGQVVAAGTPLMHLIKDSRLEWRAELPASQLASIKPGDIIRLTTHDAQQVDGRVRAVSPGVDATTRTGTVFADLPTGLIQSGTLQPGAYLQGRIDTGIAQGRVIPANAVVLRDGFPTVFTVDAQSVAHQQRIETGSTDAGFIEVIEGLPDAAQVVVEGAGFLADGDTVRVVPASTAAPKAAPAPAPATVAPAPASGNATP